MKLWQRMKMAGRMLFSRAHYAGADFNRLMADWIAQQVSATKELKYDLLTLRNRGREMARNSPLVEMYLSLLEINVIGPDGFKFQSLIRNNDGNLNKPLNDKHELAWAKWSKSVSICGQYSLRAFLKLALRTCARDGECFIDMLPDPKNVLGTSLIMWDADQLDHEFNDGPFPDGTRIVMGVHIDRWERRLGYWFWNTHPDDNVLTRQRVYVPAERIIHVMKPVRYGQIRAVSWFAPILVPLRQLMGYVEAELVAARTGAAKMGFFKYREGTIGMAAPVGPDGKEAPKPNVQANPGSFHWLPPNIEFQEWNPDHPSGAFPQFVKTIQRWVSSGLRVSYNAMANDLEGVNYTSLRSGLLIERDSWRDLQQWVVEVILTRLHATVITRAIDMSLLVMDSRDPQKFMDVRFRPRGWQWTDPLKDAQAAILSIGNTLSTHTQELAERGLDLEDVLEQKAEEKRLAEQYGVELLAAGPADPSAIKDDEDEEGKGGDKDKGSDSSVDDKDGANKDRGLRKRLRWLKAAGG